MINMNLLFVEKKCNSNLQDNKMMECVTVKMR